MRMHNVITRATRLSKNINDTLQIIQFGPESENIDDVDRMTQPAQLLCLLPHERSIMWLLRSGVHIRDKEYFQRSALRLVGRLQISVSLPICQHLSVKFYGLFHHPRGRKLASQSRFACFTHTSCNFRVIEQVSNLGSQSIRILRWHEKAGLTIHH